MALVCRRVKASEEPALRAELLTKAAQGLANGPGRQAVSFLEGALKLEYRRLKQSMPVVPVMSSALAIVVVRYWLAADLDASAIHKLVDSALEGEPNEKENPR